MVMRLVAFIPVLLAGCSVAAARPPDPCSLTSTLPDAKVTLSLPDDQRSFREGEIIRVVLSFTFALDKRYRAGGRPDSETYCLEPEARDPLHDFDRWPRMYSNNPRGASASEHQLSKNPLTVTEVLNVWRQPGRGHYRLWVVSRRVRGDPVSPNPGGEPVVLRSNTIEFDVIEADAESLTKQLREATATYQNGTAGQQEEAAWRLRFLNTKESTETLAKLFWTLNDQPGAWDLAFGIYGSPYRAEAIAAMHREINSPDHPITQDFLHLLAELQSVTEVPEVPRVTSEYDLAGLRKSVENLDKMAVRERELEKAAIAATVAALPQKTGRARALTLVTLATARPDFLDKEAASQFRRQLIANWGDLPEKTRRDLIQDVFAHWGNEVPPLDGPEALPILVAFVSQPAPHFGNDPVSRNAALKRIFDLDPAKGRSLILRDLSDPNAQPWISLVKLLSSKELQPFVQQAAQRISAAQQRTSPSESFDARPLDYSLVEMFGDKSARGSLEANFKVSDDHLPKGWCIGYIAPMLRYFLRVDPMFGAREVQAALDARKGTGCYSTLLEDLGPSLPKVEQLAISAVDDPDPEVATSAARALGRWGTAKAESALWARLKRSHEEWHDREGELRTRSDSGPRDPIVLATLLERELLDSIVSGTNWICGPEKFNRLRAITSRQYWSVLSLRTEQWESGRPWALTPNYWDPQKESGLSFAVLQYSALDEEQIRVKLSQLPRGSRLYFRTYTAEQMPNPIRMEKQQAVLQGLRTYAAQFGVTVEEWPPYHDAS